MQDRMGKVSKENPEKYLYASNETLLYMAREQKSHADAGEININDAGDAITKKRSKSSEISEGEATLIRIAVKSMMKDVKRGKAKTHKLEDVLTEEDKRRGLR